MLSYACHYNLIYLIIRGVPIRFLNNCLFNMHPIIHMPTKLDICENTDKAFDDVFNVNVFNVSSFFQVVKDSRTYSNFNTYGNQNWSTYSDTMTFVVKTLAP